jgi:hypothetical protein
MFTVHITPKNSSTRLQVGRFNDEDTARSFAEFRLKGYRGAVAEVINEHDGGFPCSTMYIERGLLR